MNLSIVESVRRFLTHKGIRQGCMAAPCLWSAFAAILLLQATEALTWTFVLNFITTFADDFCIHQHFTSVSEFEALIKALGVILDIIEGANLELNVVKTTATLRMKGTMLTKIQRKHLTQNPPRSFLENPTTRWNFHAHQACEVIQIPWHHVVVFQL